MKKIALFIFLAFGILVFSDSGAFAANGRKQIVTGYSRRAPIRNYHKVIPPPIHPHHGHFDFEYNYGIPYYTGYQPINYVPVYSTPYPVGYYNYPNSHVNLGFRISI